MPLKFDKRASAVGPEKEVKDVALDTTDDYDVVDGEAVVVVVVVVAVGVVVVAVVLRR